MKLLFKLYKNMMSPRENGLIPCSF